MHVIGTTFASQMKSTFYSPPVAAAAAATKHENTFDI